MTTNAPTPDAGLPRLERPRAPKVTAPSIDAALAEAAAAAQRSAAAAAEENAARNDAFRLSTRIETLRKTRGEFEKRVANLEGRDIAQERAACTGSIERLLGVPNLDAIRSNELNSAISTLAALRELEKLLPKIITSVRGKLVSVTDELGKLESPK